VELGRAHDLLEHRVHHVGPHDREDDFLLRLDRHAEDLFLLVDARPASEEHRAAAGTGLHRCFEHGAAPAFAHDADDERRFRHVRVSFGRSFQRTRIPSAMTDVRGASAISATRPRPLTSGSWPSADDAPKPSARRNVLASGPVATPLASAAMPTNFLSVSVMKSRTST